MNLTEFAESRNVKINAISNYMSRHAEKFAGHTKKVGKSIELDEVAMSILDEKYPLPRPVQIMNGVEPEEHKAVQDKLTAAQDFIIKLQDKMMEDQKLLAQAEAQKQLLEDKEAQLNAAKVEGEKKDTEIDSLKKANEDLRAELERLKNRSFLDRLFNK